MTFSIQAKAAIANGELTPEQLREEFISWDRSQLTREGYRA